MRFEVDPEALGRDSGRYVEALRALDGVDVGAAVAPLAGALPGGSTAAASRALGEAWGERLVRVRLGLGQVGSALTAAGQSYASVEHGARRELWGSGEVP